MRHCNQPSVETVAVVVSSAILAATVAAVGTVGADIDWLVPLGAIVSSGHLPSSIPSAAAPTSGWHDALAGAQLVVWWVYRHFGGERGLVALQMLAAGVGLGALALGLRRQARALGEVIVVCALVVLGGAATILVTRVSLFSLALYPLLLVLVEEDSRAPGRKIWLAVPLVAVWANLHGMVLVGAGLVVVYVVLERGRGEALRTAGIVCATLAATCATPALWETVLYYRAVFENEAAARGAGLWAPLGASVFDLLYVAAACALLLCSRGRLRRWEWVVVTGLGIASVHSARLGIWMLFVVAFPAVRSLRTRSPKPQLLLAVALGIGAAGVFSVVEKPAASGAALARRAASSHQVVLADPVAAERVELYGGRVLVANPIDAFRRSDQSLYLDWLAGRASGLPAISRSSLVLVQARSAAGRAAARDDRLHRLSASGGEVLYRVDG